MSGKAVLKTTVMGVLLTVMLAGGTTTRASDDELKPDIKEVAIFKNGYAFVFCQGQARPKGDSVFSYNVPAACLGTFWCYPLTEKVVIDQVTSDWEEYEQASTAGALPDLLELNPGKSVTLLTSQGSFEGVLVGPTQKATSTKPSKRDFILLETAQGTRAIPKSSVLNVLFSRAPIRTRMTKAKKKRIQFLLKPTGGKLPEKLGVGMAYLTKGMRWIPNYTVNIKDEKQAQINLQATVINDFADLKGARLHFVVGVPHFLAKDMLSPMSLQTAFTGLSSYFAERRRGQAGYAWRSNVMTQAFVPRPREPAATQGNPLERDFSETSGLAGAGSEDLFLYEKSPVSLSQGGRATISLLEGTVPYEHVYKWDVVGLGPWETRRQRERSPEQEIASAEMERAWHCLRLENSTRTPWTTGPATTLKDGRPLGQDQVFYTSPGASTDLRITIAADIATDRVETELKRKPNAMRFDSSNWTWIKAQGTLSIANYKNQAAHVIVTRSFQGEVDEAGQAGKVSKRTAALTWVNPYSQIEWDFSLKPGEEKKLTYTFSFYIH